MKDEVQCFKVMLGCVVEFLEGCFYDCFGQFFMFLELGDYWKGQFFMFYFIVYLMVKFGGVVLCEDFEWQGFIILQEFVCGVGCMVIVLVQVMCDEGINYQWWLYVMVIDVDQMVVYMVYIQFMLLYIFVIVI